MCGTDLSCACGCHEQSLIKKKVGQLGKEITREEKALRKKHDKVKAAKKKLDAAKKEYASAEKAHKDQKAVVDKVRKERSEYKKKMK